jgi:secondary thiamine-phosphate synthase enzyme
VHEFTVTTERRTQVIDVTANVRSALEGSDGNAVLVYVPHTTAGVVVQEHADPAVARDLEMALERIVDDGWPWKHLEDGEVNPWSHVREALTGTSVLLPLAGGDLALGTWQGIFFCEFDGPRTRRVLVSTLH